MQSSWKNFFLLFQSRKAIEKKAVLLDPQNIMGIADPSPYLQLSAVERDPTVIEYIQSPTKKAQLHAISADPTLIRFISSPDSDVQLSAIERNPKVIKLIQSPCIEAQRRAVEINPEAIKDIKNPPIEIQNLATRLNQNITQYIEKYQIECIRQDPEYIKTIDSPTINVQRAAISINPTLIKDIPVLSQSEEIRLKAVRVNPATIQFIKNPSREVELTAIKHSPDALLFIPSPSEEICQYAVEKKCGLSINFDKVPNFADRVKSFFSTLNNLPPTTEEITRAISNFKKEINYEQAKASSIQKRIDSSLSHFEKLGYESLVSEIQGISPSSQKNAATILSTQGKDLLGDIYIDKDGSVKVDNLQISDKITGKTEPLKSKEIDLLSHHSENISKVLEHKTVPIAGGNLAGAALSLSKTVSGWSIELMKHAVSVADSSASI